jgi:hypothetical protein
MTWLSYNVIGWPANLVRIDLALTLLAAHLIGDFVLQTAQMAREKSRIGWLMLHASILAALSYLFIGHWLSFAIPAIIWASHAAIDAIKARVRAGAIPFILDQLAHLAVIGAIAVPVSFFGTVSFWTVCFGKAYWVVLAFICGAILTVRVGGFLVGFWVQPYLEEMRAAMHQPETTFKTVRGLTNGGRLIGNWERALIFLFVGMGLPGSVGFLVAAKSIFRFGELKERENRMEAEYITIGTLMSFGWAMAISCPTWWAIQKILAM